MKVSVRNLGVIKEADVQIKPLTILVGPNNQGKTWLVYLLASIFGSNGFVSYMNAYEEGKLPTDYEPLNDIIAQVLAKGRVTIDLVKFVEVNTSLYFNAVAALAKQWMPEFMSTQRASFENLDIAIDLKDREKDIASRVLNIGFKVEVPKENPLITIHKKRGERKLYVYTTRYELSEDELEELVLDDLPPDMIDELLVQRVFGTIHRSLFSQVYVLPTERTTFINFPFLPHKKGFARAIPSEELSSPGAEVAGTSKSVHKQLSQPIGSFFAMMQKSCDVAAEDGLKRREYQAKRNPRIRRYLQLANLLEQQILGGAVEFSQADSLIEDDHMQEIVFRPGEESSLEIAITSSMAKELSPLVLYLRYLALPNELLIIDEPEMNLHPEAQVKMIEFLAMLSNAGIHVLITTHSPYLVDHLANLMKACEVEDKEHAVDAFYLKQASAFISKEDVSVYLVDHGGVEQVVDEDGIIQLDTFGAVSDHISDIYFAL